MYDPCNVYPSNASYYINQSRPINSSTNTCTRWVYDDSVYDSTFVSQVTVTINVAFRFQLTHFTSSFFKKLA